MNISDEAVEASAAAMWERRPMTRDAYGAPTPFSEAKHYQRDRFLGQARASLEAAAPHLMAEGWDVCSGAVEAATRLVAPDDITPMGARVINKTASKNPYRAAGAEE